MLTADEKAGIKAPSKGLFESQSSHQKNLLDAVSKTRQSKIRANAPSPDDAIMHSVKKPEVIHGAPAKAETTLADKAKGVGAWVKKNPGKTGLIAGGLAGGAYLMNKKKQPQY